MSVEADRLWEAVSKTLSCAGIDISEGIGYIEGVWEPSKFEALKADLLAAVKEALAKT